MTKRMRLIAGALAATLLGIPLGACGSSSGGGPSASAKTTVEATALLAPTVAAAPAGLRVSQKPFAQEPSPTTLNSTFGAAAKRVSSQLASLAEVDFSGSGGAAAYAHAYVFKSTDDATASGPDFLKTNVLMSKVNAPSDAPGDVGQASTEPYSNGKSVSYRYVFRDHNVLSYIEVDGPKGTFTIDDAVALASAEDQKIQATLK